MFTTQAFQEEQEGKGLDCGWPSLELELGQSH
jgi:hypothetical protein